MMLCIHSRVNKDDLSNYISMLVFSLADVNLLKVTTTPKVEERGEKEKSAACLIGEQVCAANVNRLVRRSESVQQFTRLWTRRGVFLSPVFGC